MSILHASESLILLDHAAASEKIQIGAHFHIYDVPVKIEVVEFIKEKIPLHKPPSGHGYYQFTQPTCILPERRVMALNKVCGIY